MTGFTDDFEKIPTGPSGSITDLPRLIADMGAAKRQIDTARSDVVRIRAELRRAEHVLELSENRLRMNAAQIEDAGRMLGILTPELIEKAAKRAVRL
jgi:hypothetical protein